jgi:hypothetical protein
MGAQVLSVCGSNKGQDGERKKKNGLHGHTTVEMAEVVLYCVVFVEWLNWGLREGCFYAKTMTFS